MRIFLELPMETLAFLDEWARTRRVTLSAAIVEAVRAAQHRDLAVEYERAWDEWSQVDAALWDRTITDGLT